MDQQPNPQQQLRFPLDPATIAILKNLIQQSSATFSAGRSHGTGVTSIPQTTTTKVTLQTNDFAKNITWNGGSSRFVVTVAGQYLITGSVHYTGVTDGAIYRIYLYVNGSEASEAQVIAGANSTDITFHATDVQNLNAGDYIELWTFCSPSGGGTISTSQFQTYLAVALV